MTTDHKTELSLTSQTLYSVAWEYDLAAGEQNEGEFGFDTDHWPDPAGWAEHCQALFGKYKPFFWPAAHRIYRTRRSAQERANLINHWGGRAVVVTASAEWTPLPDIKVERERVKLQKKRDALLSQLNDIEAAIVEREQGAASR